MSDRPKKVFIVEEGPREGFQFERGPISTEDKIRLIDALATTGLRQIQTVSFVPAKNVPGMADADQVVAGFKREAGVEYTALWLNETGLRRAVATEKLDLHGHISLCLSGEFLRRNQNRSIAENYEKQREMLRSYKDMGIRVRMGALMAAFGCNFAGDIDPKSVVEMVGDLLRLAREADVTLDYVTLADTMAWATPLSIRRVVGAVRERYPDLELSLHLHDTRGMAVANAWAGLELGISRFDAAVAGLGGCPFAEHQGAAGNICTEDLVFLCEESGIETGVDLEKLINVALLAEEIVGHALPGSIKSGGSLSPYRARSCMNC